MCLALVFTYEAFHWRLKNISIALTPITFQQFLVNDIVHLTKDKIKN